MPFYEFKCLDCERTFEEYYSLVTNTIPKCKFCNSPKVMKLLSLFGLTVKGGASPSRSSSRGKKK